MKANGQPSCSGHCTTGKWLKIVQVIWRREQSVALLEFVPANSLLSRYSNNPTGTCPKAEYVHEKSAGWEAANFSPSPAITHCPGDNVTRTSERCLQFHENASRSDFHKNRLILYFSPYSNKRQTSTAVLFICSFHCYGCPFSGCVDTLCFSGPAML